MIQFKLFVFITPTFPRISFLESYSLLLALHLYFQMRKKSHETKTTATKHTPKEQSLMWCEVCVLKLHGKLPLRSVLNWLFFYLRLARSLSLYVYDVCVADVKIENFVLYLRILWDGFTINSIETSTNVSVSSRQYIYIHVVASIHHTLFLFRVCVCLCDYSSFYIYISMKFSKWVYTCVQQTYKYYSK